MTEFIILFFVNESDNTEYVVFLEAGNSDDRDDYARPGYVLRTETTGSFDAPVFLGDGDCYVMER